MPPKTVFSKEKIVNTALKLVRTSGPEALTARGLAKKLGSSTMPVYSSIESMAKLRQEVISRIYLIIKEYRESVDTGDILTNYAMGHILLARKEKMLYRMVFLTDSQEIQDHIKVINSDWLQNVRCDLTEENKYKVDSAEEFSKIIMKLRLFVYGLAIELNFKGSSETLKTDEDVQNYISSVIQETMSPYLIN